MILDATAGNRTIWEAKQNSNIIYIDMEKQLQRKPTLFADNTNTPFLDKSFDSIFYDPPHDCGAPPFNHNLRLTPETAPYIKKHPFSITYYGWDKYKNQTELVAHIYRAQKEFYRILKDDGLLWFKWCEIRITLNRVLTIFEDWHVLMKLDLAPPTKTWGRKRSFWVCLIKEKREFAQSTLLQAL